MIKDLELKLSGELPVNREELIILINSYGRTISLYIPEVINIEKCEPNEKYDLSNLDVSNIEDLSNIFCYSLFNGDISKWNVSNCLKMKEIFFYSVFNGDISKWDISNVIDLDGAFQYGEFDGDISDFTFNENVSCNRLVSNNRKFKKKYSNKTIPTTTKEFIKWFEKNKETIREINFI